MTRLHVRYNGDSHPEDLVFKNTGDTSNFQGRYIIRNPWKGDPNQCARAKTYLAELSTLMDKRAENLHDLTGWDLATIKSKMNYPK